MPDAAALLARETVPEPAAPVPPVPNESQPPAAPKPAIRPETEQAATFEALMAKTRRRTEVKVHTTGDDDEPIDLVVKVEALDGPAFDKLTDSCPPTQEQKNQGALFNGKKFTPALLAACVTQPKLSVEQWMELQENPNWSGGEISHIFQTAWMLCNSGLDVSFTVTG